MAACTELTLGAADLPLVIFRGYIEKRAGGVFKGWNHRFFIISGNFLYEFMTDKVPVRPGVATSREGSGG